MKALMRGCIGILGLGSTILYASALELYRAGDYFAVAPLLKDKANQNPEGLFDLGNMYLYGYGELKNNNLAIRYLTESAEKGYIPAQIFMGKYSLTVEKDPQKTLYWFKKAGNATTLTQMYCAGAYLFGYGVGKNIDNARKYYIEAAKKGNPLAQYALADEFLSSKQQSSKKLGLIWLNKAVQQGNAQAIARLGELTLEGKLLSKNETLGLDLLKKAAAKDDLAAMVSLGDYYLKKSDYQQAENYLLKAANAGNYQAEVLLSHLYGVEESKLYQPKLAFLWILKAAESGYSPAQQELALMYKQGRFVAIDENLSKQWEAKAKVKAKQQPQTAESEKQIIAWLMNDRKVDNWKQTPYFLAGILTSWSNPNALKEQIYNQAPQMKDVSKNELFKPNFQMTLPKEIAINEYFNILAPFLIKEGDNEWTFPRYSIERNMNALMQKDSYVLRHADYQQNFVKENRSWQATEEPAPWDYLALKTQGWEHQANYQESLDQLYEKAILGEPASQFELGQLYQYGIAVAKNADQAVIYYQLAAEQQEVRAEYNLGILYLEGKTQSIDYQKGIDWLNDAAFKGNAYAQYVLAHIFEKGWSSPDNKIQIKPDPNQAAAMYYLASANHYGPAEYRLANYLVLQKNTGLNVNAINSRNNLIKRLYTRASSRGVIAAYLPLAFFEAIDQNPKRQERAFQVATYLAQRGNANAAILLGLLLERGIGAPVDDASALFWFQQAAKNPVSDFIIGTRNCLGLGVEKNLSQCETLLNEAAAGGFSYADLNLAILKYQSGKDFLTDLNRARDLDNSKAGILLADYYLAQKADPDNIKQAAEIYSYFAEKGDRDSQVKIAYLYDQNILPAQSGENLAFKWYLAAAEQGQPVGQYLLGRLYQLGKINNEVNIDEAKNWYAKAEKQYAKAAVALGFIYEIIENDYPKASQTYQLAVQQNDPQGLLNLGLIYEKGKGLAFNSDKAKELFAAAANLNNKAAMSQLANLYLQNLGNPQDLQLALDWYRKAAALKDSEAIYELGLLSETGVGVNLDLAKAMEYYQVAANFGNQRAQLALARMYQYGLGVEVNRNKAHELYTRLAGQDNAYAQYQLGQQAFNNGGAEIPQAKNWLQQASLNGNLQAQTILQRWEAEQKVNLSFISPLFWRIIPLQPTPDLMFLHAISEWDKGNEELSRLIIKRLVVQYPKYTPAKKIYEQLKRNDTISSG